MATALRVIALRRSGAIAMASPNSANATGGRTKPSRRTVSAKRSVLVAKLRFLNVSRIASVRLGMSMVNLGARFCSAEATTSPASVRSNTAFPALRSNSSRCPWSAASRISDANGDEDTNTLVADCTIGRAAIRSGSAGSSTWTVISRATTRWIAG